MKQSELNEHLRLHKLWLENEPNGVRANLSGANLYCTDLIDANLRSANLRSANLIDANLRSANLRSANLRSANLIDANLSGANLSETILEDKTILSFQFEKHTAYFYGLDEITIGCHKKTVKEWVKEFKSIGKLEGYSPKQIKMYGQFIKQCKLILKSSKVSKKKSDK